MWVCCPLWVTGTIFFTEKAHIKNLIHFISLLLRLYEVPCENHLKGKTTFPLKRLISCVLYTSTLGEDERRLLLEHFKTNTPIYPLEIYLLPDLRPPSFSSYLCYHQHSCGEVLSVKGKFTSFHYPRLLLGACVCKNPWRDARISGDLFFSWNLTLNFLRKWVRSVLGVQGSCFFSKTVFSPTGDLENKVNYCLRRNFFLFSAKHPTLFCVFICSWDLA